MSTIITPNTAIFKEGEVYVYTLPEEPFTKEDCRLLTPNNTKDCCVFLRKCKRNEWLRAISYTRAHPFKVHEKDKEIVEHLIWDKIDFHSEDESLNWAPQDLTEYRVEGLRMDIKEVHICETCNKQGLRNCGYFDECGAWETKQLACLMADDGVKEETLPYLAEWIHISGWVWNFGNNKWCQFSENGNQISRTTEELANEWYKIQQRQKL